MKLLSSSHEEYRVSDNEWCEFIPSTWNETRVKNIFRLITDIAPNDNDFELLSLYASIGVRPRKDMEQRGNKSVTTDGYWIVKKGDIIVNKLLAWMGAIGLSEYEGVTSPAYDILRESNQNVDARFYTYLFRTEKSQAIFKKHSRGIMDVRLRLYFDKFGAISVPFPPIAEQKMIAHYLDTKTAQIDRKIDLLTQKATQYGNLKQSLINETVTRGLDKSVPMKDSGIEWIGEVPEHWEIKRLKDIGTSIIGITYAPEDALGDETSGLLVLRSSNIQNGQLSLSDTVYVNKKVNPKQLVRKGDILICSRNGSRALIGKNICIDKIMEGQTFGAFMTVYRSKYFRFISKFFNSNIFVSQSGLFGSSTINQLTINTLNNFLLIFPPLSEQKAIADYLDTKTAQIDQITQTINTQIEKLRELRKTLINDVVTGKIRVTENQ
jgi:type I restriction enzyme, S subunit